jgi:hypothetical protein
MKTTKTSKIFRIQKLILILLGFFSTVSTNAFAGNVTKCFINLNMTCNFDKAVKSNVDFEDDANGSATNATVCMQRAKQYYDYCHNANPAFVALSVFYVNNEAFFVAASAATVNSMYSPTSNSSTNYGIQPIKK